MANHDQELRKKGTELLEFVAKHHRRSKLSPAPAIAIAATMEHGVVPNNEHMREAVSYLAEIDAQGVMIASICKITGFVLHTIISADRIEQMTPVVLRHLLSPTERSRDIRALSPVGCLLDNE